MAEQDKAKKRLGEILAESGLLTNEQLEHALRIQKNEGGLLGTILIREGFVMEADIAIALAKQNAIPYIPILNCSIAKEVIEKLDPITALTHKIMPFDLIEDCLLVASVDPSCRQIIDILEAKLKVHIQIYIGTETEITEAIKKHYRITNAA